MPAVLSRTAKLKRYKRKTEKKCQKHIDEFNQEIEIGWNAMENNDVLYLFIRSSLAIKYNLILKKGNTPYDIDYLKGKIKYAFDNNQRTKIKQVIMLDDSDNVISELSLVKFTACALVGAFPNFTVKFVVEPASTKTLALFTIILP